MGEHDQACLTPAQIEAIAEGSYVPSWASAHTARCRACADTLEAARFARRFARVLIDAPDADPGSLADGGLPRAIGYTVLGEHARGGQGAVYRARQDATGQIVAIKVLHPWCAVAGGSASGGARARFQREVRIAASLRHPGIVRLIDSLILADGRDAIVMEWIEGVALDDWTDANPELREPPMARLLGVLAEVADAVAHAHQRGVIHRDLKPSNILIDEHGRARVLDFGVASTRETPGVGDALTRTGEFTGTLAFAAPEQVAGVRTEPDTRTDVYAIGVIAYRAITGRLPYDVGSSLQVAIQNIASADPPARDAALMPIDVWTVVCKAMSKDIRRRYASASELAADLRRAARGEAVAARADSRMYVLRKAARRHRVALALAGSGVLGLLGVIGSMAVGNVRLSEALRESRLQELRAHTAVGARDRGERVLWAQLAGTSMGSDGFDPVSALWRARLHERELLWAFVEMQAKATCTDIIPLGGGRVIMIQPLEDGRFAILTGDGRFAWLWIDAGRATLTFGASLEPPPIGAAFSPSGRHAIVRDTERMRLVETETGRTLGERALRDVAFPVVAERLTDWSAAALGDSGEVLVLTLPELGDRRRIPGVARRTRPWLDPDEPAVFTIDQGAKLVRHDVETGASNAWIREPIVSDGTTPDDAQLYVSRDRRVLVVTHAGGIRVMTLGDGGEARFRTIRPGTRIGATLSADGRLLAGQTLGDSTLRLWSLPDGRELPGLAGQRTVYSHAIGTDAGHVVTADPDGVLRLWLAPGSGWKRPIGEPTARTHEFALRPGGREMLIINADGRLAVHTLDDPASARVVELGEAIEIVRVAICSRTGRVAAAGIDDRIVILPSPERSDEIRASVVSLGAGERITGLAFVPGPSTDGESALLACTHAGAWAKIRTGDGAITLSRPVPGEFARASDLRIRPDGRMGAIAFRDGRVAVIDPGTLEVRRWLTVSRSQVRSLAFSPDGRTLGAVGDDGRLHLIDTRSFRVRSSEPLGEHSLFALDFHPSGQSVAVGDILGRVTVFDRASARPVATLPAHGAVMCLRFTPDGQSLDVAALECPVERWDFGALARTFHRLRVNPVPRSAGSDPARL